MPYRKERNPETEEKARALLTLDLTKFQYSKGFRHPENVNPDSYTFDQMGVRIELFMVVVLVVLTSKS